MRHREPERHSQSGLQLQLTIPRNTAEWAGILLLLSLGFLAVANGEMHPLTATQVHSHIHAPVGVAAPPAVSSLQGAAEGQQEVQPIPATALPVCGTTIALPLGPSICVDPVYWVVHGVVGLFNWFVNWVIQLLSGFVQAMVAHDILFDTPTAVTTQNQAVMAFFLDMRDIADAALTLIVLIAGYNLMAGTQVGMRATEAREILPRLLGGALGANLAFWLIGQAVDGTNLFMHAVAGAPYAFFIPSLSQLSAGVNVWFILFFGALGIIVYEIFCVLLIFQVFTRLALLDFLIVIAPLAIICGILPQTRRAAEWWLGLLCVTLIVQPLQLLMVAMGLTLAANLNTGEGFWGLATVLLQIGLLIATFYLALRLPALLNYGLFRTVGAAGNPVGLVLNLATLIGGLAVAGFAGGAGATLSTATVTATGGPGPTAVGGGGPIMPFLPPGGGGMGGTPELPSPGAGGSAYPTGISSPASAAPANDNDTEAGEASWSASPPASLGTDATEPLSGTGRIIDGSGYTIFPDGGPL